jgi:leucyl-tRNA synthetase
LSIIGTEGSIHLSSWPKAEEDEAQKNMVAVSVQINGKYRSKIVTSNDVTEEVVKILIKNDAILQKYLEGKEFKKFIYVPGRVVNIII